MSIGETRYGLATKLLAKTRFHLGHSSHSPSGGGLDSNARAVSGGSGKLRDELEANMIGWRSSDKAGVGVMARSPACSGGAIETRQRRASGLTLDARILVANFKQVLEICENQFCVSCYFSLRFFVCNPL
jgi:hypothetical protein